MIKLEDSNITSKFINTIGIFLIGVEGKVTGSLRTVIFWAGVELSAGGEFTSFLVVEKLTDAVEAQVRDVSDALGVRV